MSNDDIRIGHSHMICSGIEKQECKINSHTAIIKTLLPVTCYASIERNRRNYTKYFRPEEEEFERGIHFNLLRKFRLLNPDKEIPSESFAIKPIGHVKERVSMIEKGRVFPVKGWWGKFKLEGSREILQTAIDCGIGAKNSSGLGCITLERR